MADHSLIGKRSKRKGKTYERRVAKLLTEFTQVNFRSVPGSGGFNKFGGVSIREELFCGDVICDNQNFRFCVEAKNRKSFDFNAILKNPHTAAFTEWWHQCIQDAQSVLLDPILFFKPDNAADFVAVSREIFSQLESSALAQGFKNLNHIILRAYDAPINLKLRPTETPLITEVTIQLPTPFVLSWNEVKEKCSPSLFFKPEKV